jgi:hypothetical protein
MRQEMARILEPTFTSRHRRSRHGEGTSHQYGRQTGNDAHTFWIRNMEVKLLKILTVVREILDQKQEW